MVWWSFIVAINHLMINGATALTRSYMIIGLISILAIDHLMINMATALIRSYMKMIISMLINIVGLLKKVLEIKIMMTTMMIQFLIMAINLNDDNDVDQIFAYRNQFHWHWPGSLQCGKGWTNWLGQTEVTDIYWLAPYWWCYLFKVYIFYCDIWASSYKTIFVQKVHWVWREPALL